MSDCRSLIARLTATAVDIVRPLLTEPAAALLDFPAHSNVGDSAIWLGELACLRAIGVTRLRHACDHRSYDRDEVARRVGRGTILLHGGANFGDLWPEYQHFRERVIADFPDNPIVQLPQSIHFRERLALDRARRIIDGHPNLTLLVRDRRSLELAATEFRAPALLCPDLAFCLGPITRPAPPIHPLLWLARTDHEATFARPPMSARELCVDWIDEPPMRLAWLSRRLADFGRRRPLAARRVRAARVALYDLLAARRLERGCRVLASARVVITDRLHGHILCILLGIPHVVLDNNYGKVSGFHETWTRDCGIAHWSDSPSDALALASSLAERASSSDAPIP